MISIRRFFAAIREVLAFGPVGALLIFLGCVIAISDAAVAWRRRALARMRARRLFRRSAPPWVGGAR